MKYLHTWMTRNRMFLCLVALGVVRVFWPAGSQCACGLDLSEELQIIDHVKATGPEKLHGEFREGGIPTLRAIDEKLNHSLSVHSSDLPIVDSYEVFLKDTKLNVPQCKWS